MAIFKRTKTIKLGKLSESIDDIIKEFDKMTVAKVNRGLRATVINVWGSIIADTPVDTGRARGNWFIDLRPTNLQHSIPKKNKGANYVKINTPLKLLGTKLYLFNNMDYIVPLEFGSSKQAPSGMVRKNIARFPGILRRAYR